MLSGCAELPKVDWSFLNKKTTDLGFRMGDPVFIRILKEEKTLEVWMKPDGHERYALYETYPICTFSGGLGPKVREGDKQSPEGFYAVGRAQLNYNSQYYLAFNTGFPNAYDKAHGYTGSYLMVHGGCKSIGCYAMTDEKIMEIYGLMQAALDNGQAYVPVHIFPFRMTPMRLDDAAHSPWRGFWRNLYDGYTAFEAEGHPPQVSVCGKEYRFNTDDPTCTKIEP